MNTYKVGILGATGLVGQHLIRRLAEHPWFEISALGASERSAGQDYAEAVRWKLGGDPPASIARMRLRPCVARDFGDCDLVFSAVDAAVARTLEPAFAAEGLAVISNSSAFRQQEDVPLLVPEVNAAHLSLLEQRPSGSGYIVTNPNCSITGLALVMAPLHRAFGLRRLVVTTLQALSGAGIEGPRALELVDNVLPFIPGEEAKMETELTKILGARFDVSAHCNRVAVVDGHLETVSAEFERDAAPEEAQRVLREFRGDTDGLDLPSAPSRPLEVREEPDRPQPRLDRDSGGGMSVVVGRVRRCPVLGLKLVLLSHNAVRGAAGGTVLNGELLATRGLLPPEGPGLIVAKFGGSSIADAERILAVTEIVRREMPRRPVVVLSALAGITDRLEEAIVCAGRGDLETLERILADVERRHRWALAGTVEHAERRHDLSLELDRLFEDLRQRLRSIRILGERTPRACDAVLAFGEQLSSRIVAAAFADRGLPARWVDPRTVMRTDDRFGGAEPDLDQVREACGRVLLPCIEASCLPVIGGFVGATAAGETTTLGRGGSDTSAAVIGLGLEVEEIQIWTDVDGLMTADPRRVPAARTLPRVSFAEAAELARYGARVLHPDAVAPAVERQIPVRILNSMRPEGQGTLILGDAGGGAGCPVGVTCRAGVGVVEVRRRRMPVDTGWVAGLLHACALASIAPELLVASESTVSLAVGAGADLAAFGRGLGPGWEVEWRENRAIVCVVGSGLVEAPAQRARVVAALARWGPEILALGASRTGVAAVVDGAVLEEALVDLHRRLFEGGVDT